MRTANIAIVTRLLSTDLLVCEVDRSRKIDAHMCLESF
jgi:hypothetical protein